MRKILTAYRTSTSGREIAQHVAEFLKTNLNCESISIFELNEISRHLTLFYTTSKKIKEVKHFFEKGSLVYSIFHENQDVSIGNNILRSYPRHTDISFEDVNKVFSMAFARIFDCYDKPVGIIRALNKQSREGELIDFSNGDLNTLIDGANILGSGLVASTAHLRATAFLDSVTHELLAPMSGAKGAAKFLMGYLSYKTEETADERNDRIMSNLDDIVRSADASISLVQGITMFSRSGLMSEHDLDKKPTRIFKDVLSKSISNVSPLIAARKFDRSKIRPVDYNRWPMLKIDQKIIEQVFSNLLSNSIKYAYDDPEGFSVDILMGEYPNGDVKITVRDYGIGIDTKDAAKIFYPGERGDRAKAKVPTGMGIGLTTVQKLLKIHGMSIELSNLSMPTEFLIRIPTQFVMGGGK
jgi:signal transduction histidine kinase